MTTFEIFSVNNYEKANKYFINNNQIIYDTIDELVNELKLDNYYHFRIHNNKNYIFFGDLDNFIHGINKFKEIIISFLKNQYNIIIEDNDIKYTINNKNNNSYHYTIPKLYCNINKLKEIHNNIIKKNNDVFISNNEKKVKKSIDTTIYSEHWFRCPNQSKGNIIDIINNNQHIIFFGEIKDFVIDYIPENSININYSDFVDENIFKKKIEEFVLEENNSLEINNIKNKYGEISVYNNVNDLSTLLTQTSLYKKMFDECYKKERFELYEYWISIGMAIKNTFLNEDEAFELFNYYSAKGSNYEGYEKTKYKYKTFIKKNNNSGYTIATIHFYAIEDNKPKFIEIMNKNTFELGQTDICKYLKIIAGYRFIYKKYNDYYKLYCYNGTNWECDDIILRHCISSELYNFLKTILIEVYWNNRDFNVIKNKIEKLKILSYKKEIIETYKEYGINNNIEFDNKWNLFGFNNIVYDLEIGEFREYQYDDYVSNTCGYDWREPTLQEIENINELLIYIMPIEEERDLLLQILSTGLDGKCLEKFIIFNGCGGNGKGVINDLMLISLGNYGMIGNNSILFETNKTGSNPEKSNIHKKRYIVFREPSEKNKFENSVIKELTGGGTFSARSHHEKTTEKELNLTMVVECNKRPLFSEEPKESETRRIIDILFRSTFTTDASIIDDKKYIFISNNDYKTKQFQETHKFALLKILFDTYKRYIKNNSILQIPQLIKDRTQNYLELSCNIVQWFKENYEITNNNEYIKIKDIYEYFTISIYYNNLSKLEKQKYNKTFFYDYFQTNIFLRNYYSERYCNVRFVIRGWKIKTDDDL
jgi:phage/plasmid-associated DNA primase